MVTSRTLESQIRNLKEDQLREHDLYGWQLAFKLAGAVEPSQKSKPAAELRKLRRRAKSL
jgi:hypothetical protein